MGRSELPIPVNKYLELEYKVQIPNVDYPDVRDKHFAIYKKKNNNNNNNNNNNKMKYNVSIQVKKITISGKTVKLEINTNPLHAMRGGRGFIRQTNCHAPRRTLG